MAENFGTGDAIFTTNFSFFATTEVISLVGATPVFVDIDEKTFNIDTNLLEESIKEILSENKLIPKAIISVDLFGQLANYSELERISKKYNLFLIEDACQSFGASYKNKKSCSFGDVAATSFFPAKPLGCYGDGGAIFTNNAQLAEIFKSIRVHGQGKNKYDNIRIGLNSRLDTIQAIVLLNKLKIFDKELVLRQKVADYYCNSVYEHLMIPYINELNNSAWAQYSLLAKDKEERDKLIAYLNSEKIPTAVYYKKLFSDLEIYSNLDNKSFPISKKISECILSLPMHPYLSETDLEKITGSIITFFK